MDDAGRPLAFDPRPALNVIDQIPFTNDDTGRYVFENDGNAVCVLTQRIDPNPQLRYCRIRRTGLPQLEQAGQVTDLNLAPDSGLLEAIHVVFFSNNIVGAEYNHFGPRLSRLGGYLTDKSNQAVCKATFNALLRRDAIEQLDRLEEIRLLDISIRPAYASFVRDADESLADALEANARLVGDPEKVQLVIRPRKEFWRATLDRLRTPIHRLLNQSPSTAIADRLQLRGRCRDTGRVETLDLLKDQLISTKRIVRMSNRSRALDAESAFQAICAAHQELECSLEDAAEALLQGDT